ncbi:hypothetical protein LTS15_000169 [Exophiala xenobiotica]|nr:hypothetical protein LTS15_000169 [Exophiala xenobiotica]
MLLIKDRDATAKTIERIRNILSIFFTTNLVLHKLDFEMQVSFEILIFIIDKYDPNLGFTDPKMKPYFIADR